ARAPGAGDAQHGDGAPGRLGGVALAVLLGQPPGLGPADRTGHRGALPRQRPVDLGGAGLPEVVVAVGQDAVDHARQAQPLAVLRAEDRHPRGAQALDLLGDDDSPAAADDPDVPGTGRAQLLHEVLEVLDVATLVGRHRHAVGVLVEDRVDDLLHG